MDHGPVPLPMIQAHRQAALRAAGRRAPAAAAAPPRSAQRWRAPQPKHARSLRGRRSMPQRPAQRAAAPRAPLGQGRREAARTGPAAVCAAGPARPRELLRWAAAAYLLP
ncbi:hypothetical protein [Paenibacillus sp. 7523-1]|uniref:hypothetical protein n=1 Tax=Paenibacillus sp. 7523-1 TaxID=2022550 RepID=UPI001595D242|nr:hypothetical protein [Paenibacillus sp. 7523-1]